jgi:hypothetical protein
LPQPNYYDSTVQVPAGLSTQGLPRPPGVVLTGAALGTIGLTAPSLNPEQAVLYLAEAVDE